MNVRRAFSRSNKRTKQSNPSAPNDWVDVQVSKARHILRWDTTRAESSREGSTSSTSTNKLRSVTFSEATTVPVHAASTIEDIKAQRLSQIIEPPTIVEFLSTTDAACRKKPSELSLQSQVSENSLRSFYDKSRAPLSISQQTSDSSSRDFALRRGTPSVLPESVQETEHLRQLRLASKLEKTSSRDLRPISYPSVQQDDTSPVRSSHHLTADHAPERSASLTARRSRSRISIIRGNVPADNKEVVPIRHTLDHEHRSRSLRPVVDPTRAKINVRRPKAGTKNWFDDVDSESDEEIMTGMEPHLDTDFALMVENALEQGNLDIIPPRTSSRLSRPNRPREPQPEAKKAQQASSTLPSISSVVATANRKSKGDRFAGVNLLEQSVLYLSSSEDEDEREQAEQNQPHVGQVKPIKSLLERRTNPVPLEEDVDKSEIEVPQLSALTITVPETLEEYSVPTPPIPERNSERLMTHLEDDSMESLTREDDLLTSFPPTPTDPFSRHTSFQSVGPEVSSQRNSRLVNLTKQEEKLIAALRSKRFAMQKVQAMAHRQDALRILESDGDYRESSKGQAKKQIISPISPISPLRISYRPSSMLHVPDHEVYRQSMDERLESCIDSERSNRSSMATYMTDTSQDLQFLGDTIDRLSVRMSADPRTGSQARLSRRSQQDLLSATGSSCTTPRSTRSKHENAVSGWDSGFESNDAADRRKFREDIPSQLFMEKPYVGWQGWEGRTNRQTVAH